MVTPANLSKPFFVTVEISVRLSNFKTGSRKVGKPKRISVLMPDLGSRKKLEARKMLDRPSGMPRTPTGPLHFLLAIYGLSTILRSPVLMFNDQCSIGGS
jgi:hypothetical protein